MKNLKMKNREILEFEAKNVWRSQPWSQAKIWCQAKTEAKSEAKPILRPGQARSGFRVGRVEYWV